VSRCRAFGVSAAVIIAVLAMVATARHGKAQSAADDSEETSGRTLKQTEGAVDRALEEATDVARADARLRGGDSTNPDRALGPLLAHERETPFQTLEGELKRPIEGEEATYDYGRRRQKESVSYVRHTGLTWRIEAGTDVVVVASGTVVWVGEMTGYGPVVIVDHGDKFVSLYAHLSRTAVEAGEELDAGDRIGAVGEAGSLEGPKLYFELRRGEQPIDPAPWLKSLDDEESSSEQADGAEQ